MGALVLLVELPSQRDVPYIVFPLLIWAALRLGTRGAATATLVVSTLTVWNTAHENGPFVRDSITHSLLSTQLFIAVTAISALCIAAVVSEREEFAERLGESRAQLFKAADSERQQGGCDL